MRTARILVLAGAAVLALAACGGGTATSTPAAPTAAATTAAATSAATGGAGGEAVTIADFSFTPQTLTASVGSTVTWTNDGAQPHTVKWSDGTPESEQLQTGDTYERTFDTAGTFDYVCGIHPQMTGSITIQ
jgi:plastocyanin